MFKSLWVRMMILALVLAFLYFKFVYEPPVSEAVANEPQKEITIPTDDMKQLLKEQSMEQVEQALEKQISSILPDQDVDVKITLTPKDK